MRWETGRLSHPAANLIGILQDARKSIPRGGVLLATPADAASLANHPQLRAEFAAWFGWDTADRGRRLTVAEANRVLAAFVLPPLIVSDLAESGWAEWVSPPEGSSWHSDPATMDPVGDLERAIGRPLRRDA